MDKIETLKMDLTTAGVLSRANKFDNASDFLRALSRQLDRSVQAVCKDGTTITYLPNGQAVVLKK